MKLAVTAIVVTSLAVSTQALAVGPYELATGGSTVKTHLTLYKGECTASHPNAIKISNCGSGGGCIIPYSCIVGDTCCDDAGDPCCTGVTCSGGSFGGACTDTSTPSPHRFNDGHVEIFDSSGAGNFKVEIKMEDIVESDTDTSLLNKSCPSNCWTVSATARRVTDHIDAQKSTVAPDNTTTMVLQFGVSNGVANTTGTIGSFAGNVELVSVVVKDEAARIIAIAGVDGIVE